LMLKACLLLLCIVLGVYAQTRTQTSVLDDYTVTSPTLVIVISDSVPLPVTQFNSVQDSSIIGGERDLILTALTGATGRVFNSGVSDGDWNIATPNGASGTAVTQYDGIDSSDSLNPKGLGGVDITKDNSDSFLLTVQTDIATTFVIEITDLVGGVSQQSVNVPGDPGVEVDYFITFSTFTGNADITQVGAIQVTLQGLDNVDAVVDTFALAGPSTTPPPPPATSPSASPIPGDSWYRFDDDNDVYSPCGEEAGDDTVFLADVNIIYYYFYGFQRPYIYVSNPNNNDATLLIPSIFACIFALFAL